MSTEIVKPAFPSAEIIPSTKLEGLEEALSTLAVETSKLPALQAQAKNLLIESKEDYLVVAQVRTDARAIKKAGKNELGKYEDIVGRVKDWLKQKRLAHENAAEVVDAICSGKLNDWDAKERAAAAAEQKRVNEENWRKATLEAEERRKTVEAQAEADRRQRQKQIKDLLTAGEIGKREADKERKWSEEQAKRDKEAAAVQAELDKQNVQEQKVLPNTPTIAGSRRITLYRFQVVDQSRIPRAFLQPDMEAIGHFWRTYKDQKAAEETIPGVRFWTENKV